MKIFLKRHIYRCGAWRRAAVGGDVVRGCGAQTHKVAKPENVVRAVGVYEWTGDMAKPTASRLIPVTVFIDGKLEDAGEYLARPVPLALLNGNVYELQQAGVGKGTAGPGVCAASDDAGSRRYDDGWFGYGAYKPAAPAKKAPALRQSKTLATVTSSSGQAALCEAGGFGVRAIRALRRAILTGLR